MLCGQDRAVWFADKSEACVWSDMHAGGLAAGKAWAGHFLRSQAAQSSRAAGSVTARRVEPSTYSNRHWEFSLHGRQSRSAWLVCLPGAGLVVFGASVSMGEVCPSASCGHSAPTEWQILHGQHIVLGAFTAAAWVWFPPRKETFCSSYQHQILPVLLGIFELSLNLFFTGTHMHACTYATPINRKKHSV